VRVANDPRNERYLDLSVPIGGIVAFWATATSLSVSSGIGFLVLFGTSVLTAVVYISDVNELRRNGMSINDGGTKRPSSSCGRSS
jgi:Cu/Ag efflux pump CusA